MPNKPRLRKNLARQTVIFEAASFVFEEKQTLLTTQEGPFLAVSMEALEIVLHRHDFQFRCLRLPFRASTPIGEAPVEVEPGEIADILSGPPDAFSD